MITTTQRSIQYNFPNISSLAENGKSLLSSASILKHKHTTPSFEATFSDFNYVFNFEVVKISGGLESKNIILYLKHSENIIIKATLSGYWTHQEESNFHLQKFDIEVERNYETPISVFLLSTLWAMLNLSKSVKFSIPDLNYDFTNSFDLSLNEINDFLQDRQIAYRLMVIERALKISLPLPNGFISGINIENIAFCYNAIVKREFDWLCNNLTFFPPSTTEYLNLLPSTNSPFPLTFPTPDEKRMVFGHLLNLQQLFVEIKQAIVINYEEAKKKLFDLSGAPVEIIVKSTNGKMRYKAMNVPILPKNAFTKDIQTLIELEEKLDSMYFGKYLNSFSDAFENLTDEQIQAITERPTLGEEAFSF